MPPDIYIKEITHEKSYHGCFCIPGKVYGMKPADENSALDTWVSHDFNVDTAGIYSVQMHYAASGDRYAEMFMDNSKVAYPTFSDTGRWTSFSSFIQEIELTSGPHTLKFQAPSDYNNDTIKTPNLNKFIITLVKAAETPAPETEAPVSQSPVTNASPQTSGSLFAVIPLAAALCLSAFLKKIR